ncbi:MAG: type IV secretion system DNA-binding domain-containing protein [Lachnospiraceae bacterium]|nr:type IV secretion system DNA-binding domain-containing protein [Lachnospiraceae bacterium]
MYEFGNAGNGKKGNMERNGGIYTRALFGRNIRDNPVPEETADRRRGPFAVFQDPVSGKVIGLNKESLSLGCLAVAAPGGGKTNLFDMILSRLLTDMDNQDVIIIFDTKGDYLAEFGSRIPEEERVVIGSGWEYRKITSYHNIFAEIMPRGVDGKLVYTPDSDVDALEIAELFFQQMHSETQPVFPAMAEQIVAGIIIYFMRRYWREDQSRLNNQELIHFFQSRTTEELKAVFEEDYMEDYKSCISYISGKGTQTQGVNSYIGAILRKMFIGPFAMADPAREFSMMHILTGRKRTVVFIEYDLKRGNALAPMYGILIDQALKNALGGRGDTRKNVYLLLDEWALLPKLKYAADSLSFGRSQGVKVMAGIQNISAIEDLYGEAGARNILAGFQNIFAFRITDYHTRRFLVERLGENYQNISFSAQNESANIQYTGHTLEEWDLMELELGQAAVVLAGEAPFLFRFPRYCAPPGTS